MQTIMHVDHDWMHLGIYEALDALAAISSFHVRCLSSSLSFSLNVARLASLQECVHSVMGCQSGDKEIAEMPLITR